MLEKEKTFWQEVLIRNLRAEDSRRNLILRDKEFQLIMQVTSSILVTNLLVKKLFPICQ